MNVTGLGFCFEGVGVYLAYELLHCISHRLVRLHAEIVDVFLDDAVERVLGDALARVDLDELQGGGGEVVGGDGGGGGLVR